MLDDQPLQLRQYLEMPAQLQIRLDLLLERVESQLVKPVRLALREGLVDEVDERLATKDLQGLTKLLRADTRSIEVRLRRQAFEPTGIDLVLRTKPQQVTRRVRLDPLGSQPLPQRGDVPVQRGLCRLRRTLTPQGVHELVAAHDLVGAQQQQTQGRQLLRPSRCDVDSMGEDLEPAQHPELHGTTDSRTDRA